MDRFDLPRSSDFSGLTNFAVMEGDPRVALLLERVFDVLRGERDDNCIGQLIRRSHAGFPFFINDNCWWNCTDAQCNFHGLYGWRPFADARIREVDHRTWRMFIERQTDGAHGQAGVKRLPPAGVFPFSMNPGSDLSPEPFVTFYANYFPDRPETQHDDHDELIDFMLLNLLSALDWVLLERDVEEAQWLMPRIGRFLAYLHERSCCASGAVLVGVQGSQVEFGHGTPRYTTTTALYLTAVYRGMREVAGLLGDEDAQARWKGHYRAMERGLADFVCPGGWFAGALAEDGVTPMGTGHIDRSPSSYFETYPNVNGILLNLTPPAFRQRIVERMASIPALSENHPALINYPERPPSEIDDGAAFPKPGQHVNGGWWWMTAGGMLNAFAQAGHPSTFRLTAGLFEDHDRRFCIDYYNEWGANKAEQWKDRQRPDMCSIGDVGAFGNLLRGLFNVQAAASGLRIALHLPQAIETLTLKTPIRFSGKEIYLKIANDGRGEGTEAIIDEQTALDMDGEWFTLPYEKIGERSVVEVRF